jgi:hypothetical protein
MSLQGFGQQIRVAAATFEQGQFHRRLLPATYFVELRPRFEQALAVHLEVGLGIRGKVVALVVLG